MRWYNKRVGCDIFYRFEVRREQHWHLLNLLPEIDWGTASDEACTAYWAHPAHIGRNYALFGLLGGPKARLAGLSPLGAQRWRAPWRDFTPAQWPLLRIKRTTTTDEDLASASQGLPSDASWEVKTEWEIVREDLAPASYITLEELLAFDWQEDCFDRMEQTRQSCADATAPFSQRLLPYLCGFVDDPKDLRMLYWFGC